METVTIKKDEEVLDLIKCKQDEILFIRYDPTLDGEATSELLNAILEFCQDLEVPCLAMSRSDEQVYAELEQWDVARLRNFDNKLQEIIKKKSPIILDK